MVKRLQHGKAHLHPVRGELLIKGTWLDLQRLQLKIRLVVHLAIILDSGLKTLHYPFHHIFDVALEVVTMTLQQQVIDQALDCSGFSPAVGLKYFSVPDAFPFSG